MLAYHLNNIFRQTIVKLFQREKNPAYLIWRMPKFYGSLITTWVKLRGSRDKDASIVPRKKSTIFLSDMTAKNGYTILCHAQAKPHKSVKCFENQQIQVH